MQSVMRHLTHCNVNCGHATCRPFLDDKLRIKKEGDIVKRPDLAATLRLLAADGVGIFYNGTMGDRLVHDVQRRGGILTKQDLINYK